MSWKVGLEILYVWVSEHFVSASGCISDAGTDAETRLLFVSKNYKFDISQDTPPTHCLLRIIRFCLCRHSHYDQAWFNCYKCQGAYVPARNVRGGEDERLTELDDATLRGPQKGQMYSVRHTGHLHRPTNPTPPTPTHPFFTSNWLPKWKAPRTESRLSWRHLHLNARLLLVNSRAL